jgi:hypothetical protein
MHQVTMLVAGVVVFEIAGVSINNLSLKRRCLGPLGTDVTDVARGVCTGMTPTP